MTVGERIVASPVEFSAQIRQAEVFYSSLAQLRAEVCDQLDEQARKLAHYERVHDAEGCCVSTDESQQSALKSAKSTG